MSVIDNIVSASEQVVEAIGYLGLSGVMAAESVLPIPSTVVLPLIGVQVGSGVLVFWAAVLAATAGSVVGAAGLYGVGRWGGRTAVSRVPRWLGLTEQRLARTESWFGRWGDAIVLLGRLVPGVRNLVSVPAGTLRMPLSRFLVLTAIGSLAWNASLIWVGTALSTAWEDLAEALSTASTWTAAAALATVATWVATRRVRSLTGLR